MVTKHYTIYERILKDRLKLVDSVERLKQLDDLAKIFFSVEYAIAISVGYTAAKKVLDEMSA